MGTRHPPRLRDRVPDEPRVPGKSEIGGKLGNEIKARPLVQIAFRERNRFIDPPR